MASVGCARSAAAPPRQAATAPFFALRLAFSDSAAGRERAQHGDLAVFMAPDPLLSDRDVLSLSPETSAEGELILDLHYRPESAERLALQSTKYVGNYVVLTLDSRVWNVVPIVSESWGKLGRMVIASTITGADAVRISEQIRSRWPVP